VKENRWNLGADVKPDNLACLPHFEGHSSISHLYRGILTNTKKKPGKSSKKDEKLKEWWTNSKRFVKQTN